MKKEECFHLPTEPGHHLALWKIYSPTSQKDKNVLFTHGTFSNRRVGMGLADYLVQQGYTCWLFEWRNHGASSRTTPPFNFDTIGLLDFPTVLEYLTVQQQIKTLSCYTHSGGGICLTICLLKNPSYKKYIESISFFGCQAFGAANSPLNYAKIFLGKYLSYLLGYSPARIVGSPHDESYYFMKQWFDWNLSQQFLSNDGEDYQKQMPAIQIPILSICGAGDQFIAPRSGCQQYLAAFQNDQNQLLFCAKATGFLEDYNHSRVLHSQNARKEIYPKVLAWMKKWSKERA